jgi:antitoxin (DNA-binding transcriptional repressor) of toxin-antitoxin stability system
MPILTVDEVQTRLPQIIDELLPGEEVVITRDNKPVAKLVSPDAERRTPVFGSCKGMLTVLAEDDDHLVGFEEYMP